MDTPLQSSFKSQRTWEPTAPRFLIFWMGSVSTVFGGVLRTPAYERGASGSLGLNGLLAVMLLVGIKAKAGGKGWWGLGGGALWPAFSG